MANPLWINYRETTHGVNANGYPDVSNRPSRSIWANFTAQHNKDGPHKADLADATLWKMETGTYTGNATDDRTISLTNASLDIKFLRIFSADSAYSWFADENITAVEVYPIAMTTQGYSAVDHIQALGTGSFQIGASNDVNKNGITFYYIVYGVEVV